MNAPFALPAAGILTDASRHLRSSLERIAEPVTLQGGEVLFRQGSTGDALYAIESGALEISVLASDGRKLTLDLMRRGDIVGEIALFDGGVRTASVTATTPSRLQAMRRDKLVAAMEADAGLGIEIAGLAGKRLRWLSRQIHEQAFLPLHARLARKLLHLTSERSGALDMSQGELADFLGASREAVSKTLATWKRDGVIELGRGRLDILDRPAVRQIASFEVL